MTRSLRGQWLLRANAAKINGNEIVSAMTMRWASPKGRKRCSESCIWWRKFVACGFLRGQVANLPHDSTDHPEIARDDVRDPSDVWGKPVAERRRVHRDREQGRVDRLDKIERGVTG